MSAISFTRQIIGEVCNPDGGAEMNTMLTMGDLNRDGFEDVIVSGRYGRMLWLENPGRKSHRAPWHQHLIDDKVAKQECGGCTRDLLGRGFPDVINGTSDGADEMAWWENPGIEEKLWTRRIIARTGFNQLHDTAIGVVTPDGRPSLVFSNQHGADGGRLWRVPLPENPRVEPWPGLELLAQKLTWPNANTPGWSATPGRQPEEGIALGDVDGDGQDEIVCGCHWYKATGDSSQPWKSYRFADGYLTTKCLIADVDGDGRNEIILAEGDPVIYGIPEGGRFAIFHAPDDPTQPWIEERIAEGLLDAHTLQIGDICGQGHPDILLGEIGVAGADRNTYGGPRVPRMWVYANDGAGKLTPHLIDEGTGTHESKLLDLRGTGVLDIVGKPLHGPWRWNLIVWYNDRVALV